MALIGAVLVKVIRDAKSRNQPLLVLVLVFCLGVISAIVFFLIYHTRETKKIVLKLNL